MPGYPCCCDSGCEHCPCTPDSLSVTFSGVTLCTQCLGASVGKSYKYREDSLTINGAYTLDYCENCIWEFTGTGTDMIMDYYSNGSCTGSPSSTVGMKVYIYAQKYVDIFRVTMFAKMISTPPEPLVKDEISLFIGDYATTNCEPTSAVATSAFSSFPCNLFSSNGTGNCAGDSHSALIYGHSGTATLTATC